MGVDRHTVCRKLYFELRTGNVLWNVELYIGGLLLFIAIFFICVSDKRRYRDGNNDSVKSGEKEDPVFGIYYRCWCIDICDMVWAVFSLVDPFLADPKLIWLITSAIATAFRDYIWECCRNESFENF